MSKLRIAGFIGLLWALSVFGQKLDNDAVSHSDQTQRVPSLSVDVDLVLVSATVTDPANRIVNGLAAPDFRVWEDKVEQSISYFSTEAIPLSVGIIFDVSGSMADKLGVARQAASTFLRMSDSEDEFFFITFSDNARLVQDFTRDIGSIQSSLFVNAKGSTALYDAVYLGLDKVKRGSNTRKALVLITDGEDNHSRYSFSAVREFACEHDVAIYSIGIIDPTDPSFGYALKSLSDITGGTAYFPDSVFALPEICARISAALKNQYVLGYRSSNPSSNGKWRKIQVRLNRDKPRLKVRARSGYYAATIQKAAR